MGRLRSRDRAVTAAARELLRWSVGELLRSPAERVAPLACAALYLLRGDGEAIVAPEAGTALRRGDQLLFAGTAGARAELELSLANEHTLHYLLTGDELAGGRIWKLLTGTRKTTRKTATSPP